VLNFFLSQINSVEGLERMLLSRFFSALEATLLLNGCHVGTGIIFGGASFGGRILHVVDRAYVGSGETVDVIGVLRLERIALIQNCFILRPNAINALLEATRLAALTNTNVFYSHAGWGNVRMLRTLRFEVTVARVLKHGFVGSPLLLFIDERTLQLLLDDAPHGVGHDIGHWIEQLELGLVLLLA
jgi:hypothetical protein